MGKGTVIPLRDQSVCKEFRCNDMGTQNVVMSDHLDSHKIQHRESDVCNRCKPCLKSSKEILQCFRTFSCPDLRVNVRSVSVDQTPNAFVISLSTSCLFRPVGYLLILYVRFFVRHLDPAANDHCDITLHSLRSKMSRYYRPSGRFFFRSLVGVALLFTYNYFIIFASRLRPHRSRIHVS